MDKLMLVGCDLHDKTMLTKLAVGRGAAVQRSFGNDPGGRRAMAAELKKRARAEGATRIIFAYEASGLGFNLHDELEAQGIRCHVLAPSKIERSPKHRSSKTDEKDATRILEILRGHYLAGNALPAVWIPDLQLRDDREVVRARLDTQEKCIAVKAQIRTLLKRNGVEKPAGVGAGWTREYRRWLDALSICAAPLSWGARQHLGSLLRQMKCLEEEVQTLERGVGELAAQPRHAARVARLTALKGVGVLSAMVFLVEMGPPERFANRRQVGAFAGLVPSSDESGETNDKKGHITHQGPARLRYILCQAVWNRVRGDPHEKAVYERLAARNPKHKKIAVVAAMRRLVIRMWHVAQAA